MCTGFAIGKLSLPMPHHLSLAARTAKSLLKQYTVSPSTYNHASSCTFHISFTCGTCGGP